MGTRSFWAGNKTVFASIESSYQKLANLIQTRKHRQKNRETFHASARESVQRKLFFSAVARFHRGMYAIAGFSKRIEKR
jgi:hypothetical protein